MGFRPRDLPEEQRATFQVFVYTRRLPLGLGTRKTGSRKIRRRSTMATRQLVTSGAAVLVSAVIVTTGMLMNSPAVQARGDGDDQESRIERGFDIAPVPLNLAGKNRALVGLGR